MARTDGLCQFCGIARAIDGHHLRYDLPASDLSSDWVTALCRTCHDMATMLRKTTRTVTASSSVTDYYALAAFEAAGPAMMAALRSELTRLGETPHVHRVADQAKTLQGELPVEPRSTDRVADHESVSPGDLGWY